jgi:TonB-dependent SusC/RagA subfamily outer membrane receptor
LKDASATAVFGVRGANGVILITTKRGKEGKARISFTTSASILAPTKLVEQANSYEYATFYNAMNRNDGASPVFSDSEIPGWYGSYSFPKYQMDRLYYGRCYASKPT